MTSATIPEGVIRIGSNAFQKCFSLISIEIPNSVIDIGEHAFSYCLSLQSVSIPYGVSKISKSTFYYCISLTSVIIPNSVTTIESDAFTDCSSLKKVSITDIADWCKIHFDNLESNPLCYAHHLYLNEEEVKKIILPNEITTINDYVFIGCQGLNTLTIPNNVTSIGERAFESCSNQVSLSLPENLKIIKKRAFYDCNSLKNLVIPSSVEYLYQEAFGYCGINEVYSMAEKPPFAYDNTFSNFNIPLYVPTASISSYKEASPWNKFTEIKTLSGEIPTTLKCAIPTISYQNGKLTFNCDTEDAICHSTITDTDIKSYVGNEVQLGVTYHISVYATKAGYENSDVATATLCWIDVEPKTEGITDDIAQIPAHAVLIQSENGEISVAGLDDGTKISVYEVNGMQVGDAVSNNGQAVISTHLPSGSIAIVKIGEKSVKITMK